MATKYNNFLITEIFRHVDALGAHNAGFDIDGEYAYIVEADDFIFCLSQTDEDYGIWQCCTGTFDFDRCIGSYTYSGSFEGLIARMKRVHEAITTVKRLAGGNRISPEILLAFGFERV